MFFFFNDTATTEIYTLSLHDALPIYLARHRPGGRQRHPLPEARGPAAVRRLGQAARRPDRLAAHGDGLAGAPRSEEHTSELQARQYLVCRLLLEKKNTYSDVVWIVCY